MLFNTTSLIGLLIALVHSVHVITSAKVEVQKKKKTRTKQLLISLASACLSNEGKHRFSFKGRSGQIFPGWEETGHCGHMYALYRTCGSSVCFTEHAIPLFVSCDPKDLFHCFCFKRSDTLSFHTITFVLLILRIVGEQQKPRGERARTLLWVCNDRH